MQSCGCCSAGIQPKAKRRCIRNRSIYRAPPEGSPDRARDRTASGLVSPVRTGLCRGILTLPFQNVAAQLPNTGRPGARSSGGRGLARPVVPGGVSLLAVLLSTCSSVVTDAASTAIITATAKSTTAVRCLFRSLLMRESSTQRKNIMRLGWFPTLTAQSAPHTQQPAHQFCRAPGCQRQRSGNAENLVPSR